MEHRAHDEPEIPGTDQQLIGKLRPRVRRALKENLTAGEQVRVVVPGANGQAIIGTDTRAFVCKPGFMAGAAFGSKITTWSYKQIVGIQVHKGMMSGAVAIQAPGQTASETGYWGNKNDDPSKAPNAIPVAGNWKTVNRNVAELRQLIAAHQEGTSTSSPPTQSPMDQIRQLVELRDAGVLSEQEFEDKKRELLSRM